MARKAPKPKTPAVKPPSAKVWTAGYKARVTALWRQWGDHVLHEAAAALGRDRADAIDDLRSVFDALLKGSGLDKFLVRASHGMSKAQAGYVSRVARIPIATAGTQVDHETWRQENLSLIKRLSEAQIQRVADIVRPAQVTGRRWEEVAKDIQSDLGIGARHARLIARDQTNKWNGRMQEATQTNAGISQYKWVTANDDAVRGRPGGVYAKSKENHFALHNTIHSWDDPPRIPGTLVNSHPGQRIQCRCVAVPVVPWLDGPGTPVREAPASEREPDEIPHGALFGQEEFRPRRVNVRAIEAIGVLENAGYLRTGYRTENLPAIRAAAEAGNLPPVTVDVHANGSVQLVDGRHRLRVAIERGERTIRAHVRQKNKAGDIIATRLVDIPTGAVK